MTSILTSLPATDEIDSFLAQFEGEGFDDAVWVDAEFYAIIAANWDVEPPAPPGAPTGLPARWNQPDAGRRWRESRQRLAGQPMNGTHHRRQRSPPNRK